MRLNSDDQGPGGRTGSFFGGAYALAAASLVTRLIGAVHRVFTYSLLQKEGVGLVQLAMPIYFMASMVCTVGIRTATSRLVAKREAEGNHSAAYTVFLVSLALLTVLGFGLSVLLFAGSRFVALRLMKDPRATLVLAVMAPGVFFEAITAAYRGLFHGRQRMGPPALSQVVEQVIRTGTTLLLIVLLLPYGIEITAAGAALGTVIGSICGFLCLLLAAQPYEKRPQAEKSISRETERQRGWLRALWRELGDAGQVTPILREIVRIAVPVSTVMCMLSITHLVDVTVIPSRLQSMGLTFREATALYGQLTGGAIPLVMLPSVLTGALQVSLVPAVTQAQAVNDTRKIQTLIRTTLGLCITLMLPAAVGLWVLSSEIPLFLYKDPGLAAAISVMAAGPLLLSLEQTLSGALQGLGRFNTVMRNLMIGALIDIGITYTLTGMPRFGILGAAYGMIGSLSTGTLLNSLSLIKETRDFRTRWFGIVIGPVLGAALMSVAVRRAYDLVFTATGRGSIALIVSIGSGVLIYTTTVVAANLLRDGRRSLS